MLIVALQTRGLVTVCESGVRIGLQALMGSPATETVPPFVSNTPRAICTPRFTLKVTCVVTRVLALVMLLKNTTGRLVVVAGSVNWRFAAPFGPTPLASQLMPRLNELMMYLWFTVPPGETRVTSQVPE